jgi:excisionase family DNA binding protein
LKAYLELTSPRAPNRITLEEVVEHMSDELFKVEEVAVRLRVNRRTAQSWIDSKELPAIDVRPDGAQRAMWRVKPEDLLRFVQDRKSKESL